MSTSVKAQEWASLTATFISGAADGTAETLKWHYDRFEKRFPGANDQYWNPKLSGDNKYKGGLGANGPKYFGSTTFLVWTTDGYHMTRMIRNVAFSTAIVLHHKEKKKWWKYAMDGALHMITYQAGFALSYNLIYK